MNFKKISIFIGIGLITISPFAIILASKIGTKNNSRIQIVGEGSSSVHPIIKQITEKGKYQIQYKASGSSAGKESQIPNGKIIKSFGMTSSTKAPESNEKTKWIENQLRTVTWAIDAISIVVKLPINIKILNDSKPVIDIKELYKLYDQDITITPTWKELLINEDLAKSTGLASTPKILGRTGGKKVSGTSDGFWHTLKKYKIVSGGKNADYNHDNLSKQQQTPEANSQAWNSLNSLGATGGLTYISLGYAIENENDSIKMASIKVPGLSLDGKDDGTTETWVPTIKNAKNNNATGGKYKWRRPFNIIYSILNKESIDFVWYLLSPSVRKIIDEAKFISLTRTQIIEQLPINKSDNQHTIGDDKKYGLDI